MMNTAKAEYLKNKFAVAAFRCSLGEKVTYENAATYISTILHSVLENMDMDIEVSSMQYPKCSKVPLIITIDEKYERLFWFNPAMDYMTCGVELEGVLEDLILDDACVPA